MAVISVPSSIQGQSYTVRIAGNAPTPEEQARINAYVAQMDARVAPPVQAAPPEEPSMLGEIGSGVGRGFFGTLAATPGGIGSLLEAGYGKLTGTDVTPGSTAFGGALQDISEGAGAGVESMFGPSTDSTAGQLAEAVGSIGSFIVPGAAVGTGLRLAGAGARAAGLGGTAASAGMGAALGADQQAQEIGDAILAGEVIDPAAQQSAVLWGGLIGSSEAVMGGAVSRGIGLTYKILNKVPPAAREEALAKLSGRIASAIRTGGIEGAQEALSQIAQNIVSREYYDPERDITEGSGEAFGIGGTAGAIIDLALTSARAPGIRRDIQRRQTEEENKVLAEIEQDQAEDAETVREQIEFGQAAIAPTPEPEAPQGEAAAPLALPAPERADTAPPAAAAPQVPEVAKAPAETAVAPRKPAPFRWERYTAAAQAIAEQGDASVPAIQRALSEDGKTPAAPAVAKAARSQMEQDGIIARDKSVKGGYRVQSGVTVGADPAESYRRTLEDLTKDMEDARQAQEKAAQDARRAQQTGSQKDARNLMLAMDRAKEAEAKAVQTAREVEERLARVRQETAVPRVEVPTSPVAGGRAALPITEAPPAAQRAAIADRSSRLQQAFASYQESAARKTAELRRLREDAKKVQLPSSERDRMAELQKSIESDTRTANIIKAQLARPARDVEAVQSQDRIVEAQQAFEAAQRAARAPIYASREGELFTALRKRLDNLGLKDVRLVAERMIMPEQAQRGALIEGMMDVDPNSGARVIALSMGIYDPKMSQQQLFDAISAVMNHEVIHALRSLGVFTNAEWKVLSDLAARQRYMRAKNGKTVERSYTYLQRARQMYPDSDAEVQVEEAVAEMFRDYVAGRLKIGGRPKTLMDRIKDFFRSVWKSHEDIGITDPNALFEGIRFGEVGRRERRAQPVDGETTRQSRVAAQRAPSDPDFQSWASGPKGERVVTEQDGTPRVYYTGTSKDQDFTKFKVGRHGGWFTTDPAEASSYAQQNDSMGYRYEGWKAIETNQASRVIPTFLRAAKPFTGEYSGAITGNYKRDQSDWFDSLRRQGYDAWMPSNATNLMVVLGDDKQVKSVFARGADGKGDMRRFSEKRASPTQERLAVLRTKNRDTNLVRGVDELVRYAEEQVSWRDWYDRYQGMLEEMFGDDSGLFRNILSATSQAASVPANVGLAIKAYDQMLSGQEFTGFLPAVIKNLNRIRSEQALSGQKIGEYGRANVGDEEGIAIDRHVAMIMFDVVSPTAQQVEAGKAAIRVIANRLGWKPREVQAALWAANIARTGKEPQSYDTYLIRKADAVRAIRDRFPPQVDGRGDRGAGAGRGADVGAEAAGTRYSRRVVPAYYQGEAVGLTQEQVDQLSEPIEETIDRVTSEVTEKGGIVIRADQVENMARDEAIRKLKPQDLVGMKIVPTIADRTAAGAFYEGIDSAGVDMAIPLLGGPFFPLRQTNIENSIVWANRGKSMLTRLRNAIEKGATHMMVVLGDADMHISNTTVANSFFATLEGYARQGRFTPEQAAALTDRVRNAKEADPVVRRALMEFPGVSDFAALDSYLHRISFEARKRLLSILGTKEAQGLGAPSMTKILRATRQKELAGNRWGDGVLILELDKDNLTVNLGEDGTAPHPDFPLGVRGKVVGRLETPLSYELVWRDFLNETKANKIKEGADPEKLNPRRSFETSLPLVEVTQDLAEYLSSVRPLPIDGYRQARLAADFASGNWKRSTDPKNKGGVSPQAFLDAIDNSDASATLSNYVPEPDPENPKAPKTALDVVKKAIKEGSMLISQLGDGEIYYGLQRGVDYEAMYGFTHPDLTDSEVGIVSVVSNEQGARGIGGPAIMIDAIANGATVLDAFSVKSKKFPNGFLPTFYREFGFEVLGEIPFDSKHFGEVRLADLKATWQRDGWEEGDGYPPIVVMKWKGTEDDRRGITSRYLRGGTQGLLAERAGADAAAAAADLSFQPVPQTGAARAADAGGTRGLAATGGQRSLASRLRETALYISALNDAEVRNLGVTGADRERAIEALTGDKDSTTKWGRRKSVRYSVSPITPQVRRKVQSNKTALMYGRSSDAIAKILNLRGYGIEMERARDFTDGVLRRFQDNMLPIGRMVQELANAGMTITDAMDPYLQEELMHGVVGRRIGENQTGLFEPLLKNVKKLNVPQAKIDQLIRASDAASAQGRGFVGLALNGNKSPSLTLAEAFLYARHAKERNRYIQTNRDNTNARGSGMTDAEADAILNWFRGLDPANQSVLADIGRQASLIVADTNQTRLDGGLISEGVIDPEDGATIANTEYKFYVPLRGKVGETENDLGGPPSNPRFGARGREDRRALGRYDYPSDIIANLFTQNQNAVLRAERNKVGQSFLKLLRGDPQMTSSYARILPKAPTTRTQRKPGVLGEAPDRSVMDDANMLVVKEDGKEVWVEFVDDRLSGVLNGQNGMSPTNGRVILGAMQALNRYLASINTSYNPEFIITNAFRDLQTAGVNVNQYELDGMTREVMSNIRKAGLGIKRYIRDGDKDSEWSKLYQDYMNAGGQNATNQFSSLAEEMDNIRTLLGDISEAGARGQWTKVKNSFVGKGAGSLLNLIEDYNTMVENTVRLSAYKSLLDRGFTRQRAAQAARNLTVNFAKGGDYRPFLNAWSLFYNASLQGSFALLNAATRSSKVRKMWLGVMAIGILQDQLNALLSDEDEDGEKVYDKIPDHILERNIVLPDIFGISDRSYISIPMPYGLNMAHNIGRATSRAMRGEYDPGEASYNIAMNIVDTLNPLGGTESLANFFAPTIADPFIDIIENEDFANKPIFKEGLPFDRTPAPDSQQYWSTTSPSAVWIAKNLNELTGGNEVRPGLIDWSPDVLEFWFSFATGGVGRFIQSIPESAMAVAEQGVTDESVRTVPFARKLVGTVSSREDTGTYVEGAKAILTAAEELKRAREVGDADWARETMQRYQKELRLVGPIKSIESSLRQISRRRNQIEDNPSIPEEQKRVLLEGLDARKQALLSRANGLIRQAGL